MIELLDSNWISNVLSITFTLVIFLLGIPVLFVQTYVPESLRKYYLELAAYKEQAKQFKLIFFILLIFIIFIGNQGVRFLIFEACCTDGDAHCDKCYNVIIIYYFISLIAFIALTYYSYLFFKKNTEKRLQVKKLIIEDNFRKLRNDLKARIGIKDLKSKHKTSLDDLYGYFSEGVNRTLFFEQLFALLFELIQSEEFHYTGKELKLLFGDILFDTFIHRYEERTQLEIDELISFVNELPFNRSSTLDREYLSDTLLFQLATSIVSTSRNANLFLPTISALRSLKAKEEVFYKIFKKVFFHKRFQDLESECRHLLNYLKDPEARKGMNEFDLKEVKLNLVSYVSWFYFLSRSSREQYKRNYIDSGFLDSQDFILSKKKMQRKSEFITADKISKLIKLEEFESSTH